MPKKRQPLQQAFANHVSPPVPKKPVLKDEVVLATNSISTYMEKFTAALESLGEDIKAKQSFDFLKKIPGKIKKYQKRTKDGKKKKKKKSKGPRSRKPKKERKPKKKRERRPPRERKEPRIFPQFITTEIAQNLGLGDVFASKAGRDPRRSTQDVKLEDIGRGGGNFVKQEGRRYVYDHWNELYSHQKHSWQHIIWLDPSAPSAIIHPGPTFAPKKANIVKGKCPSKLDMAKEFGTNVEFIYMSPPWDSPNFGYGKRGYFTCDHLAKMDLSKVQEKGFIFMWLPFHHLGKILKIMEKHMYTSVDSCGAMLSNFNGQISVRQRNPNADKNSSKVEDLCGRMAGTCVKGVLWKKTLTKKGKERFRIGNQIMYDCFQWREKIDKFTGQLLPDHGYAYAIYQYLMIQKPPTADVCHALHLWCPPNLRVKNFGGVQYFPNFNYKKDRLKS